MYFLGNAEEPRHLAGDHVQADAAQVSTGDGIGHVLDEAPQAHGAEGDLDDPGGQPQKRQQGRQGLHPAAPCWRNPMTKADSTAAAGALGVVISRLVPPKRGASTPSAVTPRKPAKAPCGAKRPPMGE